MEAIEGRRKLCFEKDVSAFRILGIGGLDGPLSWKQQKQEWKTMKAIQQVRIAQKGAR